MSIIRKWDKAPKQTTDKCIEEIITRIEEIDSENVGVIAAQDIIDIVTENLAPHIYNAGIRDAKKLLQNANINIETDLDLLEQ